MRITAPAIRFCTTIDSSYFTTRNLNSTTGAIITATNTGTVTKTICIYNTAFNFNRSGIC